jgi:hypothetical protein
MYIAKERNKSIAQVGILTNAQFIQYIYTRSGSTTSSQVCKITGAVWDREQVPSKKGRELVMESRK